MSATLYHQVLIHVRTAKLLLTHHLVINERNLFVCAIFSPTKYRAFRSPHDGCQQLKGATNASIESDPNVADCVFSNYSQQKDDFDRFEVFVGVSNLYKFKDHRPILTITPFGLFSQGDKVSTRIFTGVNGAASYNLKRYFGLKFDYSLHTYSRRELVEFATPPIDPSILPHFTILDLPFRKTFNNVYGGLQIKDNSRDKRLRPFAHLLFGSMIKTEDSFIQGGLSGPSLTIIPARMFTRTWGRKAVAIGGGLDVKLSERIQLRVIQIDYNQSKAGEDKLLRIGSGILFN